jgi:hypothetical protein
MSPYVAYVAGVLTVVFILILFYILSLTFIGPDNAWNATFCSNVPTTPGNPLV